MSNGVGQMKGRNFLADAPTADDIMNSLMGGEDGAGWDGINNSAAGQSLDGGKLTADQELQKCFARVYATPDGKRMIEGMMRQSIHRSPYLNTDPDHGRVYTVEQQTAYGLERKGQNGFMVWVLSQICNGQNLPDPAAKKSTKKKS